MLAIDRDIAPRPRGCASLGGPGCFGEAADYRAQRVLFAARAWIAAQDDLATDGRALLLLHAQRMEPERRDALLGCFERLLLHAPRPALAALAASLRASGASVDDSLVVLAAPAGEVCATLQALERFRPFPSTWRLAVVDPDEDEATIRAIQALQVACGIAPLPGWILRGGDGRAATLTLRGGDGAVLGCSTMGVVTRPPWVERDAGLAVRPGLLGAPPLWIADIGEPPSWTGMPLGTCLRDDARGRGLAAPLLGAALRVGHERLGIRWFYALARGGDEIAIRASARCGLVPHHAEGFLFAKVGPGR